MYALFFYMQRFFQLSLGVAELFHELGLKCCLSIAYYIQVPPSRDTANV